MLLVQAPYPKSTLSLPVPYEGCLNWETTYFLFETKYK